MTLNIEPTNSDRYTDVNALTSCKFWRLCCLNVLFKFYSYVLSEICFTLIIVISKLNPRYAGTDRQNNILFHRIGYISYNTMG